MDRATEANLFADDLDAVMQGQMSEEAFRAKHQHVRGGLADTIWPYLEHYLTDIDIREREPAYREMQDSELAKFEAGVEVIVGRAWGRALHSDNCDQIVGDFSRCFDENRQRSHGMRAN